MSCVATSHQARHQKWAGDRASGIHDEGRGLPPGSEFEPLISLTADGGSARWVGIDRKAALWTIPSERMKMREEHRVSLSKQALDVLARIEAISGSRELVFPSPYYPSTPLSENTFNSALARMG